MWLDRARQKNIMGFLFQDLGCWAECLMTLIGSLALQLHAFLGERATKPGVCKEQFGDFWSPCNLNITPSQMLKVLVDNQNPFSIRVIIFLPSHQHYYLLVLRIIAYKECSKLFQSGGCISWKYMTLLQICTPTTQPLPCPQWKKADKYKCSEPEPLISSEIPR